jgi:hypothetical protein
VKAIEVGLLTRGSSYLPTPSRPFDGQWFVLLAFVPAHSGTSVRDLHPLPSSSTSIALTANVDIPDIIWSCGCQAGCDTGRECILISRPKPPYCEYHRRSKAHEPCFSRLRE